MRKTKETIRKESLRILKNQDRKEGLRKSGIIKKKLFSLPEFKKAGLVMFYASKPEEVDTSDMIREALEMGKRVALPRCTGQGDIVPKEIKEIHADLEKSSFGIYEPRQSQEDVRLEEIDLVVVPGVAFDKKQNRLGRGKGYYDRFLKKLPKKTFRAGLSFRLQITENLPKDLQDIPVSKVITD